uniref:Uncharacterized protein n=1 Tax=Clytia hemisphaerica TaxID=252671 RepID=A0A7M5X303_9CNID
MERQDFAQCEQSAADDESRSNNHDTTSEAVREFNLHFRKEREVSSQSTDIEDYDVNNNCDPSISRRKVLTIPNIIVEARDEPVDQNVDINPRPNDKSEETSL